MADTATQASDNGTLDSSAPTEVMPGFSASSNNPEMYDFDDVDDGLGERIHTDPVRSEPEPETKTPADPKAREGDPQRSEPRKTGEGFDAALLDRARQFGLSAEQAREYETPAALTRALDLAERRSAQRSDTGQPPQREQRTDPPADAQGKKTEPRQRTKIDLNAFDEIDTAFQQFDPSVQKLAKTTRALAEQLNSALDELDVRDQRERELLGRVESHHQYLQSRQIEEMYDQFDRAFTGLGPEYESLFGKGSRNELTPDGSELKERLRVLQDVAIYSAGLQASGQPVPGVDALVKRAVRALYGDRSETETTVPKEQVKKQLRDRASGQFTARPTQRHAPQNGKNLTDADRTRNAHAFVNRFFQDRGTEPEVEDGI